MKSGGLVEGGADAPGGGGETGAGLLVGAGAQLADETDGAVAELGVGGAEVDHEVAADFAKTDHGAGGEDVEGELGGGAGFEAGGAGDELGAGGEVDFDVPGVPGAGAGGIAGEEDGFCPEGAGAAQCAEDEGGASAGGDAADDVAGVDAALEDGELAGLGLILGALGGGVEGTDAAGDDALDKVGGGAEGGRDLAGIEDAETAAGACAGVEEAAAGLQGGGDEVDGGDEGGAGLGESARDFLLFKDEEVHEVGGGEAVHGGGAGIALLCGRGGEVWGWGGGEGGCGGDGREVAGEPGGAEGAGLGADGNIGAGDEVAGVVFEEFGVLAVMLEEAAEEADAGGGEVEAEGDGAGVLGKGVSALLDGGDHFLMALFCGLEDDGGELGDGHFVGVGGPGDEVFEAIEGEDAEDALTQDVGCEVGSAAEVEV